MKAFTLLFTALMLISMFAFGLPFLLLGILYHNSRLAFLAGVEIGKNWGRKKPGRVHFD